MTEFDKDSIIGPGIPQFKIARIILIFLIIFSLIPIFWIILTSFKDELTIFSIPPKLFFQPDLTSYKKYLSFNTDINLYMLNSIIVSVFSTFLTLILSSLAAYGFSRYRFKFRKQLLFTMLATKLLPPITAIVPLYLAIVWIFSVDTLFNLIVIYTALNIPFGTWLMKAFIDGIPKELEEAAAMDGCSVLKILTRITAPLSSSGLAATAIFVFLLAWNEFMFAFMLTNVQARTMPVRLSETVGEMQIYWQEMATMATLIMLPALVVGFCMQKYFVRALTAGALK